MIATARLRTLASEVVAGFDALPEGHIDGKAWEQASTAITALGILASALSESLSAQDGPSSRRAQPTPKR